MAGFGRWRKAQDGDGPDVMTADLAKAVKFTVSRPAGYHPAEVDRFVRMTIEALAAGEEAQHAAEVALHELRQENVELGANVTNLRNTMSVFSVRAPTADADGNLLRESQVGDADGAARAELARALASLAKAEQDRDAALEALAQGTAGYDMPQVQQFVDDAVDRVVEDMTRQAVEADAVWRAAYDQAVQQAAIWQQRAEAAERDLVDATARIAALEDYAARTQEWIEQQSNAGQSDPVPASAAADGGWHAVKDNAPFPGAPAELGLAVGGAPGFSDIDPTSDGDGTDEPGETGQSAIALEGQAADLQDDPADAYGSGLADLPATGPDGLRDDASWPGVPAEQSSSDSEDAGDGGTTTSASDPAPAFADTLADPEPDPNTDPDAGPVAPVPDGADAHSDREPTADLPSDDEPAADNPPTVPVAVGTPDPASPQGDDTRDLDAVALTAQALFCSPASVAVESETDDRETWEDPTGSGPEHAGSTAQHHGPEVHAVTQTVPAAADSPDHVQAAWSPDDAPSWETGHAAVQSWAGPGQETDPAWPVGPARQEDPTTPGGPQDAWPGEPTQPWAVPIEAHEAPPGAEPASDPDASSWQDSGYLPSPPPEDASSTVPGDGEPAISAAPAPQPKLRRRKPRDSAEA